MLRRRGGASLLRFGGGGGFGLLIVLFGSGLGGGDGLEEAQGGSDWSLRLPSTPRTIHGMRSGPSGSFEASGSGLGLGGAKEMVNSMEEEKEHVMRGRVRKGEKCVWDLEKQ